MKGSLRAELLLRHFDALNYVIQLTAIWAPGSLRIPAVLTTPEN